MLRVQSYGFGSRGAGGQGLSWVLAPGPPVGHFVPVQVGNLHDNALFLQLGKLRNLQKRGLHQQLDEGHSGQSIDHDAVASRARLGDVVLGLKYATVRLSSC